MRQLCLVMALHTIMTDDQCTSLHDPEAPRDRQLICMQGASLDVRIKWPNDLMAAGQKLGGILCHSAYSNRQFVSTIGVGLNLSNRQPTTCIDALVEAAHASAGLPGSPNPVTREVQPADAYQDASSTGSSMFQMSQCWWLGPQYWFHCRYLLKG